MIMGYKTSAASFVIALLFSVSFSTIAQAERHKQVASANSHCNIECYNDGYCSFTKYADYPLKGDIGYYKSCTCRPGFGGGGCEKVMEECQPPLFQCHNGAPCEMDENGVLGCDCSAADAISDLAGYMCRRPVIQVCDTLDESNKSYCTNGGVCLSSMTASPNHLMFSKPTTHEGCQCDDAFYGDHCEFIRDMPESSLVEKESERGATGPMKAGITLSVLIGVVIVGAIVISRRRRQRQQLQAHANQSWKDGEQKFRNFYEGNLANNGKDRTTTGGNNRDQDTESDAAMEEIQFSDDVKKEEGDLQSMLSSIDASIEPEVYEDGTNKSYFA